MTKFAITPPVQPTVAVKGGGAFPVRRIFCIGRNYADHVKEMGGDPKSDPPVFFTKPSDAVTASGAAIPYAQATDNLHFEGELVVALKSGSREISADDTDQHIFGFAAGCDLTRRDHQAAAKKAGAPWDTAKGFDGSAPVGEITPHEDVALKGAHLSLSVNGARKQDAPLSSMIWSVPEIIAALSNLFELKGGDLIFTGTPEGVGPLTPGDQVEVVIGELAPLTFDVGDKA